MTQQRDIGKVLDIWLGEGSSVAPDRVIDVVADRIERQPQRGAWRVTARELQMPTWFRLVAIAAVVSLAVGGATFIGGSPQPSAAPPTPGPSSTMAAASSPSPSPYLLPSTSPSPTALTVTSAAHPGLRVELPAGWFLDGLEARDPIYLSVTYGPGNHPAGSILIRANPVLEGGTEPCSDAGGGTGGSAAAIVAALQADQRFATVSGDPVTVGGLPAQVLDIGLSERCGSGDARQAIFLHAPGSHVGIHGDQRVRVVLLEVDGVPLLIGLVQNEEDFDGFVARAMEVVETITFLP
jgi:hypothetical protein